MNNNTTALKKERPSLICKMTHNRKGPQVVGHITWNSNCPIVEFRLLINQLDQLLTLCRRIPWTSRSSTEQWRSFLLPISNSKVVWNVHCCSNHICIYVIHSFTHCGNLTIAQYFNTVILYTARIDKKNNWSVTNSCRWPISITYNEAGKWPRMMFASFDNVPSYKKSVTALLMYNKRSLHHDIHYTQSRGQLHYRPCLLQRYWHSSQVWGWTVPFLHLLVSTALQPSCRCFQQQWFSHWLLLFLLTSSFLLLHILNINLLYSPIRTIMFVIDIVKVLQERRWGCWTKSTR